VRTQPRRPGLLSAAGAAPGPTATDEPHPTLMRTPAASGPEGKVGTLPDEEVAKRTGRIVLVSCKRCGLRLEKPDRRGRGWPTLARQTKAERVGVGVFYLGDSHAAGR
jgi:hypothetical protein